MIQYSERGRYVRLCILFAVAVTFANVVRADLIYSLHGAPLGTSIYTVDTVSGNSTNMGNFGGFSRPDLYGLASRPGDLQYLYSVDTSGANPQLKRIDVTGLTPGGSAFAESIGFGFSASALGISSQNFRVDSIAISALSPNVGVFSAFSGPFNSFSRSIFRADLNTGNILGPAVTMSPIPVEVALAYSLDGTVLYGSMSGSLYTIDPSTGNGTLLGSSGVTLTGLAFNPNDGTLFGGKGSFGSNLYTVNTSNGSLTDVAGFPAFNLNPTGFAFVTAVPEPSAPALMLVAFQMLANMRFRRT